MSHRRVFYAEREPVCEPISPEIFRGYVAPYFSGMGWEIGIGARGPFGVSINALFNSFGKEIPRDAAAAVIKNCLRRRPLLGDPVDVQPEGATHWHTPAMTPEEEEEADREPVKEIFDYTELRKGKENAEYLQEYRDFPISVHRNYMVGTVKLAFEKRGWIYAGNQYGNGNVIFEAVLIEDDNNDKVVAPAAIKAELDRLEVVYHVGRRTRHPSEDIGGPERNLEPTTTEDFDPDLDAYVPLEEEKPISLKESIEAEIGQDAGELEAGLGSGEGAPLTLEEGEEIGVTVTPSGSTGSMVLIILDIGSNEVPIVCSRDQAFQFFTRNVGLAAGMALDASQKEETANNDS